MSISLQNITRPLRSEDHDFFPVINVDLRKVQEIVDWITTLATPNKVYYQTVKNVYFVDFHEHRPIWASKLSTNWIGVNLVLLDIIFHASTMLLYSLTRDPHPLPKWQMERGKPNWLTSNLSTEVVGKGQNKLSRGGTEGGEEGKKERKKNAPTCAKQELL